MIKEKVKAWLFADIDAVSEVRELASDSKIHIEYYKEVKEAVEKYVDEPPNLLLFAYMDMSQAERTFLELYRTAIGFAGGEHPSILLCKGQDAHIAYDLIKRHVFDDYVVFRPLYDPFRLNISIHHLLGRQQTEDTAITAHKLLNSAQKNAVALQSALVTQAQTNDVIASQLAGGTRKLISEIPGLDLQLKAIYGQIEQRLNQASANTKRIAADAVKSLDEVNQWLLLQAKRLAVVDDDPVYLNLLTKILEQDGYEVKAFTDPLAALVALPRIRPEAVLVDINMPVMGGIDLVEKARKIDSLSKIPYFIISGNADVNTVRDATKLGVSGFIVKPGNRQAVLAKLKEALSE